IVEEWTQATGKDQTKKQIRSKYKRCKQQRKAWSDLVNKDTGFGWDPTSNTVTGNEAQRQAFNMGFPNYELMSHLFAYSMATSWYTYASTASPSNTNEECELKEGLNRMKISGSCRLSTLQPPSQRGTARQSSPTIVVSEKRGSNGSSSINQTKHSKGKSTTFTVKDNAMLKFVGIAAK
ncbi:hypothetical protein CJ030_MR1G006623, partial [Morella rubra]